MTTLTLYGTNTAATTIPTANKWQTAGGGSVTTPATTKIGTSTGWGQLVAQGSTANWPAKPAIQAPNGLGFLLDATTLESQQIAAGTWSPTVTLSCSNGTIVAQCYMVLYLYKASGLYYTIGTTAKVTPTLTTTPTAITYGNLVTTQPTTFETGDKLYSELWIYSQTNSTGNNNATIAIAEDTAGGDTGFQLVTPAYSAITIADIPLVSTSALTFTSTISAAVFMTFSSQSPLSLAISSANVPLTTITARNGITTVTAR